MANKESSVVRGKLACPYYSLESALGIAKAIHDYDEGPLTPDELANILEYASVKSGVYQMRASAARKFGFVDYADEGISVTKRAKKILSPVTLEDVITARQDAFLAITPYKEIYDKFKGKTLPDKEGLINLLKQDYNLTENRAAPAMRVFISSAKQAGLYEDKGGEMRLKLAFSEENAKKPKSDNEALEEMGVHSAIIGLLKGLPKQNETWTSSQKTFFKAAFMATLDFIYPTEDEN